MHSPDIIFEFQVWYLYFATAIFYTVNHKKVAAHLAYDHNSGKSRSIFIFFALL